MTHIQDQDLTSGLEIKIKTDTGSRDWDQDL